MKVVDISKELGPQNVPVCPLCKKPIKYYSQCAIGYIRND